MNSPHRRANDPFEILVELTAAAMSARPPRDFVYAVEGRSLLQQLRGMFARQRVARSTGDVRATGDVEAGRAVDRSRAHAAWMLQRVDKTRDSP